MMCDFEGIFSRSFVISVNDARLGLFHRVMEAAFGGCGFYVPPRVVRGCTDRRFGNTGRRITKSHVSVVEWAKAMKMPSVLIFEDDAFPRPDAAELMKRHLVDLPDDCGTFQLGSNWRRRVNRAVEVHGLYRVADARGAHAYIVFASAYDAYIAQHRTGRYMPIDMFFGRIVRTYIPPYEIFIQYTESESSHRRVGYWLADNRSYADPPDDFLRPDALMAHTIGVRVPSAPINQATLVQPPARSTTPSALTNPPEPATPTKPAPAVHDNASQGVLRPPSRQ